MNAKEFTVVIREPLTLRHSAAIHRLQNQHAKTYRHLVPTRGRKGAKGRRRLGYPLTTLCVVRIPPEGDVEQRDGWQLTSDKKSTASEHAPNLYILTTGQLAIETAERTAPLKLRPDLEDLRILPIEHLQQAAGSLKKLR